MEFVLIPAAFLLFIVVVAWGSKKAQRNEDAHKAADKKKRGW